MEAFFILTALLGILILRTPVAFALGGLGVILLAIKGMPLGRCPNACTAPWTVLNCWPFRCFY